MKVRLFFVYKKCVRHPYVLDEFRSHRERFDAGPLAESQSGVRPELSKIEIQGEILATVTSHVIIIWVRSRELVVFNKVRFSPRRLSNFLTRLLRVVFHFVETIYSIEAMRSSMQM